MANELPPQSGESPQECAPTVLRDRLFDYMSSRTGVTLGANALYSGIFGEAYDSSLVKHKQQRVYLQLMFNPKHSFGKLFHAQCIDAGMAVQVGTMYIDREEYEETRKLAHSVDVPARKTIEENKRRKRVYRMFAAEKYSPNRDEGLQLGDTFFVDWEPAVIEVEVIARDPSKSKPIHSPNTPRHRKRKKQNVSKKAPLSPAPEVDEVPEWVPSFTQSVRDAIIQKNEEGLMSSDTISATAIRARSSSPLTGTETNRKRLHAAGLIGRDQLDLSAPFTPVQLILATIFNPNKSLFGQRTKAQRAAVEIVKAEVESILQEQK